MTTQEAIDYLLDPIGKRDQHDEAIKMAVDALQNYPTQMSGTLGNCSELPNSTEFWRKRAKDYENMVIDLISKISKGAKLGSMEMNAEGLVFKMKELPAQDEQKITHCENCKHKHLKKDVWTCPFGLPGGPKFFCGYGSDTE